MLISYRIISFVGVPFVCRSPSGRRPGIVLGNALWEALCEGDFWQTILAAQQERPIWEANACDMAWDPLKSIEIDWNPGSNYLKTSINEHKKRGQQLDMCVMKAREGHGSSSALSGSRSGTGWGGDEQPAGYKGELLAARWHPESDPLAQLRQLRASGLGALRHEVLLEL